MYASINAHKEQDLAPRDDMWSLFYIIVDLLKGELPWKEVGEGDNKDRGKAGEQKEKYNADTAALVEGISISSSLLKFAEHLKELKYEDFPDYAKLCALLGETPADDDAEAAAFQWAPLELTERQNIPEIDDFGDLLGMSEDKCAKEWPREANSILALDTQHINTVVMPALLDVAKKHNTFFLTKIKDTDEGHSWTAVQHVVYRVEERIRNSKQKKRALPKISDFNTSQIERPDNPKFLRKTLSMALGLR